LGLSNVLEVISRIRRDDCSLVRFPNVLEAEDSWVRARININISRRLVPRNVVIVSFCSVGKKRVPSLLDPQRSNERHSVLRDIRGNGRLYRVSIDIFITVNSFAN